ncbi:sortase [Glycomyces sp. NPDC047369]
MAGPRMAAVRTVARSLTPALLRVSVGALGLVVFAVGLSWVQAHREQAVLDDAISAEIADPGAILESIPSGTPLAKLTIEEIGLDGAVVVQGTTAADLDSGLGHRKDSVLPGQTGVSVVYGRQSMFGAPFMELGSLRSGDEIGVVTPDGSFTFTVDGVRRDGDPLPVRAEGDTALVLVSAEGSPFRPTKSIYVDATLTDRELAAGAVTEATALEAVGADETAMAADPGGWFTLVLWLQALVVALVAMSWTRHRLSRREALIMGLPVLAAVMWNLYEAAFRLLPNLL